MLLARVGEASRGNYDKITDTTALEEILGRYDSTRGIPGRSSITLDTSELTPDEAAVRVLDVL
jgi:hypothetical protein